VYANRPRSVLNLAIGVNGLKFWVRQHKQPEETSIAEVAEADVKEKLLGN